MLGLAALMALSACGEDDESNPDNEPGGGGEEKIFMTAMIDEKEWIADTVSVSVNGRALNITGKPYSSFLPNIGLTINPNRPAGVYPIGVTGQIENAGYTRPDAEVFLGQTGEIEIIEHRVNEYIKGKFSFTASHSMKTLPDVVITGGEFESFY